MIMIYFFILGTTLPVIIASSTFDDVTLVETKSGPVKGQMVTGFTQKDARAFYGIPYAEPPIGNLRFKPPVPVSPWTVVFDATRIPFPCFQQYTKNILRLSRKLQNTIRRPWSENCLTLNIWTPVVVSTDSPVSIIIHGGDFMTGTGAYPHSDWSTASVESDQVFISINYRVGIFGFLSLGTEDVPGNLGLMDQHLALKWIHENVAQFGGKNSAIFIIGTEAGAASVGHQMILPENNGIFRTVALFGGSPLCDWSWHSKEKAVKQGKSLLHIIGCDANNHTLEVKCLQAADPNDILDACSFGEDLAEEHFKPNIDGTFIKEMPIEAMKAGRFNNVNVIINNGLADGSLRFLALNEDILKEPGSLLTVGGFREAMKRGGLAHTKTELDMISDWYLGTDCAKTETEIRDAAIGAYSDGRSLCCAEKFLEFASQREAVTFKVVYGVPDSRFPEWIGSHDHAFLLVFSADVLNPRKNYSSEMAHSSMATLQVHKQVARKKATEIGKVLAFYNLVDRPYLLWKTDPEHLKHHRTNKCVLWNQVLPEMRIRRHSCSRRNT